MAIYVRRKKEDPIRIASDVQTKFMLNVQLATELGGNVVVLDAEDICQTLLEYCRKNDISLLVLGKTERRWWQFTRPNLLRFFVRHAPAIDLHIVDPCDGQVSPR
jgi:two-component system sensor histidine kinase KdpD